MKLTLNQDIVFKLALDEIPVPGTKPLAWESFSGPNYLIYDAHKDAPPGFAVRVGKKSVVYLVDKRVAGKKLKIPVGLASGKKGEDKPMTLTLAREEAWRLSQEAKKHGANPKDIAQAIDAAEITLGQVFDIYEAHLKGRAQPAKPNSMDSLAKARAKVKDWEDRKVRLITSQEIVERFDHHAVEKGHRTAAEAMGRWATAAVDSAIEMEIHDAHGGRRAPALTYNPFTILKTKEKYRKRAQLERDYKAKGVRNPLSFTSDVGPYVKALWTYRAENPVAADFILITMLWGMRRGESATFQWRDQLTDAEAAEGRWIDIEMGVAFVGDSKNRSDHEFPIAPCAIELLKRRRAVQIEGEKWVFPARSPHSAKGFYSDPSIAMDTVKKRAGLKVVRGHDLRRTFGAACEKLGYNDRQIKRLLGHGPALGETLGRYTTPEWADIADRMQRVEELILSKAPSVYNALRPKALPRMGDAEDILAANKSSRPSRRRPR